MSFDSSTAVSLEGIQEYETTEMYQDTAERSVGADKYTDYNAVEPQRKVRSISPNYDRDTFTKNSEHFNLLKNWEGVVTAIEEDTFFASMRLTDSENRLAEDEFEIDFDNVPEGDRGLVCEGAIFYLTVGKLYLPGEGPQKVTRIIFRRMPRWSASDIERAEAAAEDLWENLKPK